ncbi:phosphopantetheine-binding protein [Arthrobacter sp. A5]|uniref:phosphopantetheine-binding protein n=1 Tax=Arthrobacter sp. A5 TaxID=576926 RepID=UPI003DA87C6A
MDVDSLSLVEIAVMVSEKYGFTIQDWEIAEAGNFPALATLIGDRRAFETTR